MISFSEATEIIRQNVTVRPAQRLPIESAVGFSLAEDIVASIDVVSYRNSAMDGFAVKAEWLSSASVAAPVALPYRDTVFAGDKEAARFAEGVAVKVMTGAPVPEGYDAVVPFEHTSYDDRRVEFSAPIAADAYVRLPGEDIQAGQTLFTAGHRVSRLDIGIMASVGLADVSVVGKPSILVATTGNELTPPGTSLSSGSVYNSNLYTIEALAGPLARSVKRLTGVGDSLEELQAVMASNADVIITSGGVSAGERDLVMDAAEAAGFDSLMHKVRIKPGKPVYLARRGDQLLFGLPGNPLSTAVTCAVFVLPALKKMGGWRDYRITPHPARLSPDSIRKSGRMLVWPGSFTYSHGEILAEFSPKRSSAALSAVLGSDGLIFQSSTDEGPSPRIEVVAWEELLGGGRTRAC